LPQPITPSINHFKCYRVTHGRTRIPSVTIDDQFGTLTLGIRRPFRLCVPVTKNSEPTFPSTGTLMCYQVKPLGPLSDIPNSVFINNQFGNDIFQVRGPRELCVPSDLNPRPSPSPTTTIAAATASPTPTEVETPSPSPTPTESGTPIESATPTESPTGGETATPTPEPTPAGCAFSSGGPFCGGLCDNPGDTCVFTFGIAPGCACVPPSALCAFDPNTGTGQCGGACSSPFEACVLTDPATCNCVVDVGCGP
jgi:hypothetical protein